MDVPQPSPSLSGRPHAAPHCGGRPQAAPHSSGRPQAAPRCGGRPCAAPHPSGRPQAAPHSLVSVCQARKPQTASVSRSHCPQSGLAELLSLTQSWGRMAECLSLKSHSVPQSQVYSHTEPLLKLLLGPA